MRHIERFVFAITILGSIVGFAATAEADAGGDVGLSVPVVGGPIVTSGGDYTGDYAGRVFEGIISPTPPLETDAPGFYSANGTFTAGANIRFDFVKQLLYWNGTALTTPTSSLTLSFGSSTSATIGGSDTEGLPGFVIAPADVNGAFHRHLWFSLPDNAAVGLYGTVLTLGPGPGATGFSTSDSFLIAFSNGSFDDPAGGLDAMVNVAFAPVPEPSAVALAGLGVAGLVIRAWRRRRAAGKV